MNTDSFYQLLRMSFPFAPSAGQEKLLYAVSRMMCSDKDRCALVIKGYAGTGKTTSVDAIVKALDKEKINSVLLAPTGRAAKVMAKYTKREASTIHRRIYAKRTSKGGINFELAANTLRNAVFIVDEASMIGRSQGAAEGNFNFRDLLEDLIEYVYNGHNCRLILIGDGAQLPPIGVDVSPALDLQVLRGEFYLTVAQIELTEVVRQAAESGILANATALREEIRVGSTNYPKLTPREDVVRLEGSELQDALEEEITKQGRENVLVITRSNKAANLFNQQIRVRVHWLEDRISAGDLMMVVKNNYYWLKDEKTQANFIANGDMVEVMQVRAEKELYGMLFYTLILRLLDYPDMPHFEAHTIAKAIDVKSASIPFAEMNVLYENVALDYLDLGSKARIRQAVKDDQWYNALQMKFGYAVTCHKAQGGQWPVIFIDQGYLTEEMMGTEYLRWLYTALTRAVEKVYLINFHPNFFED